MPLKPAERLMLVCTATALVLGMFALLSTTHRNFGVSVPAGLVGMALAIAARAMYARKMTRLSRQYISLYLAGLLLNGSALLLVVAYFIARY
jgi:hypothetical protein